MKKSLVLLSSIVLLTSNLFGIVYSDGTNPNDWKYYTSSKGEVSIEDGAISLKGNGTKSGAYLQLSPITKDASTVKWRMKFTKYFNLYVQVVTNKGVRYLGYYPLNNFSKKSGRFLKIGIGKSARNGKWQTFTRDINKDLESLETGLELHEIKAFFLRGTGLIDDVEVNKDDNANPPDTHFDFKKFDELLKAEDDGEWGFLSTTTIEETGNPRIKVRHIDYSMDNPPYRAIYTLSRDNNHLVTIDPSPAEMYSGYGSVKVSKDNRKLIIDDGWQASFVYAYKEYNTTDLFNVHEITHSKSKLFDIVGKIAKNLSRKRYLDDAKHTVIYTSMYEVEKNASLSINIIGISRIVSNSSSITFYMMNKSGNKAEKILQTKMLGSSYTTNLRGKMEDRATITNDFILNIKTNKSTQAYDISKCLDGATEGCAELVD